MQFKEQEIMEREQILKHESTMIVHLRDRLHEKEKEVDLSWNHLLEKMKKREQELDELQLNLRGSVDQIEAEKQEVQQLKMSLQQRERY